MPTIRTIRVTLLRDCPLGLAGATVRVPEGEGQRACMRGWAKYAEPWQPARKTVRVDVKKHA